MTRRLRILSIGIALIGIGFIAAGGFAYMKTQEGYRSLNAFSAAQHVTLTYNDQGQLVDGDDTGEAQAILALLKSDWGFPVVDSELDPNDPVINTASEYMYQMATVTYHTLHATTTVVVPETVEYNGEVIKAGEYEFVNDGRYWVDFDRMDGHWSSPDLPALLRLAALNRETLALNRWIQLPLRLPQLAAHRARRNTLRQSRANIRAHYDLGNEFYRLFLDESLTYSSAVFATLEQSLADAQRNKYRIIAERAGLVPGMHVLEIGSGWGGFALYAAGELDCRVTTITISKAQHGLVAKIVLRDHSETTCTGYCRGADSVSS